MNALLNPKKSRLYLSLLGCVVLSMVVIFSSASITAFAQGDDGIPGNCPYTHGIFYAQNLFPRYEGGALALVDWTTGETQRTIPTTLTGEQFQIGIWSPECQYLSGSFGTLDDKGVMSWDTAVWDVVNNVQLTTFEDARIIPHPLTWDTNSTQILVETRFGAYLWKFGAEVWLTSVSRNGLTLSFR